MRLALGDIPHTLTGRRRSHFVWGLLVPVAQQCTGEQQRCPCRAVVEPQPGSSVQG